MIVRGPTKKAVAKYLGIILPEKLLFKYGDSNNIEFITNNGNSSQNHRLFCSFRVKVSRLWLFGLKMLLPVANMGTQKMKPQIKERTGRSGS